MKYNNKKCSYVFQHEQYDFDSKAEMNYFIKLSKKLQHFEIEKLKLQPNFLLQDGFTIKCDGVKSGKRKMSKISYTPDFEYFEDGKHIVVEVKGVADTSFRMRLRLFLARMEYYGIDEYHLVYKDNIEIYAKIVNAKR